MVLCSQATWGAADGNGKQKCFETRKSGLVTEIDSKIGEFQQGGQSFRNYVRRGGISQDDERDPEYDNVKSKIETVIQKLTEYENLNKELSEYIKTFVSGSDPTQLATVQSEITALQKQIKDAKTDYENAKSRQENVEKPRQQVSNYQGLAGKLGFSKPFHKVSIAIFLALGILFIFLSFMLVREILNKPDTSLTMNYNAGNSTGSIFSNTLLTLVGIVFLFVLLGLFAASGKF
jgi:hypothetical protein